MKRLCYIVLLFSLTVPLYSHAQMMYRGCVKIKQNATVHRGDSLMIDMTFRVSGLKLDRHQSLRMIPVLRNGKDSLLLKPIVINGANKQKMHNRELKLKANAVADQHEYAILPNPTGRMCELSYRLSVPYRQWMSSCSLVLVGLYENYDGRPTFGVRDVLTTRLVMTAETFSL